MTDQILEAAFHKREQLVRRDWSSIRDDFAKDLRPKSLILDVGVGDGQDSKFFENLGHNVISVDKRSSKGLSTQKNPVLMNLESLGFQDQTFDAIWLANVIIFVDDDIKRDVLSNVHRIMKPQGRIFICDNFFPTGAMDYEMTNEYGDDWHTSENLHNMVESTGFRIYSELCGVDIPEKRGFGNRDGFHVINAIKV